MSEVKRYRYLLDEAVMESVGSNPSYRTAEGPAWMDADEVTTRIAELEAENQRLLGQPGRQHTISYLEDLKAENKRLRDAIFRALENIDHDNLMDKSACPNCILQAALEEKS